MKQMKRSLAMAASNFGRSIKAKAAATGTGLALVGGSAMAGGGTSPGSAIANALNDAPQELGLVFAAVAVAIGLILVFALVKRAARG
jgi:hypothetical protein